MRRSQTGKLGPFFTLYCQLYLARYVHGGFGEAMLQHLWRDLCCNFWRYYFDVRTSDILQVLNDQLRQHSALTLFFLDVLDHVLLRRWRHFNLLHLSETLPRPSTWAGRWGGGRKIYTSIERSWWIGHSITKQENFWKSSFQLKWKWKCLSAYIKLN